LGGDQPAQSAVQEGHQAEEDEDQVPGVEFQSGNLLTGAGQRAVLVLLF